MCIPVLLHESLHVCVVLCVFVACTYTQCKQGSGTRHVRLVPGSFVLVRNVLLYANMSCIRYKTALLAAKRNVLS